MIFTVVLNKVVSESSSGVEHDIVKVSADYVETSLDGDIKLYNRVLSPIGPSGQIPPELVGVIEDVKMFYVSPEDKKWAGTDELPKKQPKPNYEDKDENKN